MGIYKALASSLLIILVSSQIQAEPSKPIAKMITTQTSTFDFFLFKLEEKAKCYRGWFGNSKGNNSKKPCLTTLNYSFEDNLIQMNFFVDDTTEKMKNFRNSNDKNKEIILKAVLANIATTMGVEENNGMKLGMIQMTTLRNGWAREAFDETEVKEEIAKRTVIVLTAKIKDGFIYRVTRNHHGKVFFEKNKSKF